MFKSKVEASGALVAIGLALLAAPANAAPKALNLLASSKLKLDRSLTTGVDFDKERLLRDGDLKNSVSVFARKNAPAELVYHFDGQTVSPRALKIRTTGPLQGNPKIEVLVSTLSASTGFKSLRVEPIKTAKSWQTYSFEQSGAKWIIIKVTSTGDSAVSFSEIELRGHEGPPVTAYKFNESPTDAINVLRRLPGALDIALTADETSLFADAADGKFDTWSFAAASLMSSGVTAKAQREAFLKQIDELEQQARASVPSGGSVFKRGEALLKWLHAGAFKKGYQENQTDVSTVLRDGAFNCVSSATLYNILAHRLGLDIRGIEVPTHAFSILYDGTRHADIETTTARGFDPARNKTGLNEFERKTGYTYIPDKYRSKRREVKAPGLVALSYYNHGVFHTQAKRYPQALLSYFKALSLDPKNKSAIKNILAVLGKWSVELSSGGELDKALAVLATGLELAPTDYTLRHNHKVVLQQSLAAKIAKGDVEGALASVKDLHGQSGDKSYLKMQAWIFARQSETKIKQGDWEGALGDVEAGLPLVDAEARKDVQKLRAGILLRWSSKALDQKDYQLAMDVLARGLSSDKRDYRIENNLGYTAQVWSAHVEQTQGVEASRKLVAKLAARFPQLRSIEKAVVRLYDQAARKAVNAGNYEEALSIYALALREQPNAYQLKQNHRVTWDSWAKLSIKTRNWKAALDIYERALKADPHGQVFKTNATYVVQEWSKQVAKEKNVRAAEELVASIVPRFPKISGIYNAGGKLATREITGLLRAGEFEQAEGQLAGIEGFFANANKYRDMVTSVYHYWSAAKVKAGDWNEAIAIYKRGYEKFPKVPNLKRNMLSTLDKRARVPMDKKDWEGALEAYQDAHELFPSDSLFKRNIAYIVQEWSRQTAKEKNAVAGEELVASLAARFPKVTNLKSARGQLLARDIMADVKAKRFEEAEGKLGAAKKHFSNVGRYNNLVLSVYVKWVKPAQTARDWENVVSIYSRGHKHLPGHAGLKRNLIASWNAWGMEFVDKKQWQEAEKIFQRGAKALPSASVFQQNLRYVKSKMK